MALVEKQLQVAGRIVNYRISEGTRPVVLLHPFPFDGRFWVSSAARLGSRFRVIIPDMRGFGASDLGGDFSLADLADDLAALMDHLGVARALVGGLSMGGYVAQAFAARHSQRLGALLLADTKSGPDAPAARAARDEAISLVQTAGTAAYVEKQLPRLLGSGATDVLKDVVRGLMAQPAATVIAGLKALRDRPDRTRELPGITCPALIVVGDDDVLTPPDEAQALATAIPGAALIQVPGVGHLTPLEAPGLFGDALVGFANAYAR